MKELIRKFTWEPTTALVIHWWWVPVATILLFVAPAWNLAFLAFNFVVMVIYDGLLSGWKPDSMLNK